jgi:DNA repair exonuclease SbcCD ATPase subunit
MLKFAVDGSYFVSSIFEDKKKSRQIIERLVGSVKREEMSGNYECIDELLKKFSLEEIDSRCANLIKGIDSRLNEIPTIINQKNDEIAEIEQTDFVATDREIAELEAERDRLDKQMTDLTERIKPQMEAKHEAERTYQMKKDVLDKAYEDWKKSFDVRRQKLTDEINTIKRQNANSNNAQCEEITKRRKIKDVIEEDKKRLVLAKQKRQRLIAERDAEKAKTLDKASTLCPHCGAELQGEKLQAVIDNFERVKRERIEAIVNEGKRTAAEI